MAYGSRVTWKKGIPMANSSDRQYRLPDKPEEYQEDSSYPETGETMAAEEMKKAFYGEADDGVGSGNI
ncbi:MAG: hypothetical protein HFH99_02640 [Lachnospiraceae bacterium]|nr:hypothetical protein [Lachnospiraceae bacterium]